MTRWVHQEAAGPKCSIPEPGMISDGKQQFVLESSRLMGPLGKVWIATKRYVCLLLAAWCRHCETQQPGLAISPRTRHSRHPHGRHEPSTSIPTSSRLSAKVWGA